MRRRLKRVFVQGKKAIRFALRRLVRLPLYIRDQGLGTVSVQSPPGDLARYFPAISPEQLEKDRERILATAAHFMAHRFDLLGSGWVQIKRGMMCRGLEGYTYPADADFDIDVEGYWLNPFINRANRAAARQVWRQVDADYVPIDWQRDFKSGWRWSERTWYLAIRYGHQPGADIKAPWELARMQHLPQLAFAYALTRDSRYTREFRNQVLDFIATNPPRFGVNWYSAMDVGIRVANWLIIYDLFRAHGASFDAAFEDAFRHSIYQHSLHLRHNLEWRADWRGNHYLAAVAGLLFAAAYLPPNTQIQQWRAFAIRELIRETALQFQADGSNFEASTCYHRLSAEIVTYATALALRLDPTLIPDAHIKTSGKMANFTLQITKPDGHVPQIGDNDSGRFLKLQPAYRRITVAEAKACYENLGGYSELPNDAIYWDEDHLDHRHLLAAIFGLTGHNEFAAFAADYSLETLIVRGLANRPEIMNLPLHPPSHLPNRQVESPSFNFASRFTINCEDGNLLEGLTRVAFPDFGLYLYRSRRLYLAIRCGAVGQRGNGGHAHNDQLAIELTINGLNCIVDPGTYLYSALPTRRNEYRSVMAHFAPQQPNRESGRLDLGLFSLGDDAQAHCLTFGEYEFVGQHSGYGSAVYRRVRIEAARVVIEDSTPFAPPNDILFSPGYGIRCRKETEN